MQEHLTAERLMGVEIVAQQGVIAGGGTLRLGGQPAFGGVDFAVLFDLPVLRHNEFRAQRHDLSVARTDDHRSDGAVEMRGLAVGVADTGTMGAVDVFGLRGKIPGGVQRDERVPPTARMFSSKPVWSKAWCRSSKRLKRWRGSTGSRV